MNGFVQIAVAAAAVAGWRLYRTPGARPDTRRGGVGLGRGLGLGLGLGSHRSRPAPRSGRDPGLRLGRRPGEAEPARWAGRHDVRALVVPSRRPGRLTLGTAQGRLLAAERGHSVLVVGPTQSRKTSGFAVPAILEWEGPVVAASVKSDLARHTQLWRAGQGQVWVYDPSASTGLAAASWSPLQASVTWQGARRTAASLTEVARSSPGALSEIGRAHV